MVFCSIGNGCAKRMQKCKNFFGIDLVNLRRRPYLCRRFCGKKQVVFPVILKISRISSAVEQLIRNQQVEGSNPLSGSTNKKGGM